VKYEEVERDVPSLSKLRKCASNVYSVDIIRKMELAVLIELDWELARVCSAHFLESVLALTGGGTFPHDDVGDRQWTSACCVQLRKLAGYLHSICLQDGHVGARVSASQLAAAIVATARLQLGIYPVWPVELRVATGYGCDVLGTAMSSILKLYKEALPPAGIGEDARRFGDAAETRRDGEALDGDEARETAGAGWFETANPERAFHRDAAPRGNSEGILASRGSDSVFQAGTARGKESGNREFLTPSPVGPLDAGSLFDERDDMSVGHVR